MPDIRLTELPELTTLSAVDKFYVVDDPNGTPVSSQLTASKILSFIPDLPNNASPSGSNIMHIYGGAGGSGQPFKTTINDFGLVAHPDEGARVTASTTQEINHATLTTIAFDLEDYDTNAIHDTVTNNSRLTCKRAGKYRFIAIFGFSAGSVGNRLVHIQLNGTNSSRIGTSSAWVNSAAGAGEIPMIVATETSMAVNDYAEVVVYQSQGTGLSSIKQDNFDAPTFIMRKVG